MPVCYVVIFVLRPNNLLLIFSFLSLQVVCLMCDWWTLGDARVLHIHIPSHFVRLCLALPTIIILF